MGGRCDLKPAFCKNSMISRTMHFWRCSLYTRIHDVFFSQSAEGYFFPSRPLARCDALLHRLFQLQLNPVHSPPKMHDVPFAPTSPRDLAYSEECLPGPP